MAKLSEYTINGPPAPGSSPSQLHKSLSVRREKAPNLRALYRHSADLPVDGSPTEPQASGNGTVVEPKTVPNGVPTTPNLPPTPPAANGESPEHVPEEAVSEAANFRSALVTPINQNSPPTPDNTPPRPQRHNLPRPWLETQASFASTRAESFKTAREEITSDEESVVRDPRSQASRSFVSLPPNSLRNQEMAPSRLRSPLTSAEPASPSSLEQRQPNGNDFTPRKPALNGPVSYPVVHSEDSDVRHVVHYPEVPSSVGHSAPITHPEHVQDTPVKMTPSRPESQVLPLPNVRRGPSLRDRLRTARRDSPSASTEKFASIIGWTHAVTPERMAQGSEKKEIETPDQELKRLSGISNTSTIGAMVIDSSPRSKRRTTLRKMQKTDSLRSASSPLPASNRTPTSQSGSPHRLVHKKVRLSNDNRYSFGSDKSRSQSLSSSILLSKPEIIKVAVIPERSSSLQSSANSSKRHSLSNSSGRTPSKKQVDGLPPSSWQHKRTMSESDRGRDKPQNLAVPARNSSLSAPTSRSTSRANSITSESLRKQRRAAETDLRKTLDRMESERLISSLKGSQFEISPVETPSKAPHVSISQGPAQADGSRQKSMTPGTSEWAALRPPSILQTPFSQTSYKSGSPDIVEATAINFFPHTNHSLQLIEPNLMQESRAVREVRKQGYAKNETSSPLRNPRQPPEPPQFQVTPLNRGNGLDNHPGPEQLGGQGVSTRRRPSHRRSESFVKSLTRGLSLKNAKNRKGSENLDGSLNPMWKPQAFWDDHNAPPAGTERALQPTRPINNSLGLPQERTVVNGPVSLVRRMSERRKQRQELIKQSSRGSLSRLRATHQLYMMPSGTSGVNWLINLREIPDKLLYARQKKEDERKEKRRAALRQSIGANVISQGDSRFPASNSSLVKR